LRKHPKTVISAFFQIKFWIFLKALKKNALDTIRLLFQDESIAIDIFPQLKIFPDFSRAVSPFLQKPSSQKLDPSWNCFCCELF